MRKNIQTKESNGIRVLIVDDETGIIDSLSIFLKRFGYDFMRCYRPTWSNRKGKDRTLWFDDTWLYNDTNTWGPSSRRNT